MKWETPPCCRRLVPGPGGDPEPSATERTPVEALADDAEPVVER